MRANGVRRAAAAAPEFGRALDVLLIQADSLSGCGARRRYALRIMAVDGAQLPADVGGRQQTRGCGRVLCIDVADQAILGIIDENERSLMVAGGFGQRRMGGMGGGSRPPMLPLVMEAQEFGLPLDKLLDFLKLESRFDDTCDLIESCSPGRVGRGDPRIGQWLGEKLTVRIGSMLSRPGCRFQNAFLWRSGRDASQHAHLDRPGLDVTMSVPLVLEGADRWALWAEQPDGDRFEWAGVPGTVLILDGRRRVHGRDTFEGTRYDVLLLHWRAPAVLWPGFLGRDARSRLAAADAGRIDRVSPAGRALLDCCLELARSAAPWSKEPRAVVCAVREAAEIATRGEGASFLTPLDGKVKLTFDALDAVALQPGDGLAFPRDLQYGIDGPGGARVLVGESMPSRRLRPE